MCKEQNSSYVLDRRIFESSQLLFLAQGMEACQDILIKEITELGGRDVKKHRIGVFFWANLQTFYQCVLFLRTARSISLIIKEFDFSNQQLFYQHIMQNPWFDHLSAESSFNCEVSNQEGTIPITPRSLKGMMRDAIIDSFRKLRRPRPTVNEKDPDLLIKVFIDAKKAFLSITLAHCLHKRSWNKKNDHSASDILIRKDQKKCFPADLAATMLYRAQWPEFAAQSKPFIDGLCESAVFLAEACAMAYTLAPQLENQKIGFEKWKPFNPVTWITLKQNAKDRFTENCSRLSIPIHGYETKETLLKKSRSLIKNDLFTGKISVIEKVFFDQTTPLSQITGLFFYNLPFSETEILQNPDQVLVFYTKCGQHFKKFLKGWHIAVLLPSEDLIRYFDIRSDRINTFIYEKKKIYLTQFIIHETSLRTSITAQPQSLKFKKYLEKRYQALYKLNQSSWESQAWRLYNSENPTYRALCDIYDGTLIVRPLSLETPINDLVYICQEVTGISRINTVIKRYHTQHNLLENTHHLHILFEKVISEKSLRFYVDLTSHHDAGFDITHRGLRRWIINNTEKKSFLDLFCYTGSLSITALVSGSSAVCAVDASQRYLNMAKRSASLNPCQNNPEVKWIHSTVDQFLEKNSDQWDIICINCPVYSFNSTTLVKNRDKNLKSEILKNHINLLRKCRELLHDQSLILFSTYTKSFELDPALSEIFEIQNMTMDYLDEDCREGRIPHFLWHLRPKPSFLET